MPGVAFPPWVPWATVPHLPRYYAPLRLPLPVSGRFACRSLPDPLPASARSWCPFGLVARVEAPDHARAFGHPVPHSGNVARRQVALPSSRVTPMEACPARRVEIRRAQR